MKKKTKYLFFLIGCIFLLSGCGSKETAEITESVKPPVESEIKVIEQEPIPEEESSSEEEYSTQEERLPESKRASGEANASEFEKKVIEVEQTKLDSVVESELEERRKSLGLTEENVPTLKSAQEKNYYYHCLSDEEKLLYVEMLQILSAMEEGIMLTTKDENLLSHVYQAVINDHPELFYTKGFLYTKATIEDEVVYLTFSGSYTYTKEEKTSKMRQIEEAANQILKGIPAGADEYATIKYLYEYIVLNTDYGEVTRDHQNISSVLLDKVSVCNGYSKTLQFLLGKKGIPCIIVNGDAKGNHAWNIVCVDGEYYHVDVTWGDPSYNVDGSRDVPVTQIDYSYLCIPTSQICVDHTPNNEFELPECVSMNANYFVKEGMYFTGYDENRLLAIFRNAVQNGKSSVMIKASDKAVYDTLVTKLFQEQKVFGFLGADEGSGITSLAYSQNDSMLTISIWY